MTKQRKTDWTRYHIESAEQALVHKHRHATPTEIGLGIYHLLDAMKHAHGVHGPRRLISPPSEGDPPLNFPGHPPCDCGHTAKQHVKEPCPETRRWRWRFQPGRIFWWWFGTATGFAAGLLLGGSL